MTLPSANDSPPSSTHASPSRNKDREENEATSQRVWEVAHRVKIEENSTQSSVFAKPPRVNLLGRALFQTPESSSKQDRDQSVKRVARGPLGLKYGVKPLQLPSIFQQQEVDPSHSPSLSPTTPTSTPQLSPSQTSGANSVWPCEVADQVDGLLRYLCAQLSEKKFTINWSDLDWPRRSKAINDLKVALEGDPLLDSNKRAKWVSQLDQASKQLQLFLGDYNGTQNISPSNCVV